MTSTTTGDVELRPLRSSPSAPPTAELSEEDLPPLVSYVPALKFWMKVSARPILVITFNAVFMTTLVGYRTIHFIIISSFLRYRAYELSRAIKTLISLTILLLVDAYLLFRGQGVVKDELEKLENEERNGGEATITGAGTDDYNLDYVHARLSRMIDNFLSKGGRRRRTNNFLVHLLCAMFAVSVVLASIQISTLLQLFWMKDVVSECLKFSRAENVTNTSYIPKDVMDWARGNNETKRHDKLAWLEEESESTPGFIQTTFGWTFFVGSSDGKSHLVAVQPNSTLTALEKVSNPGDFMGVNGNTTFCCLYSEQYRSRFSFNERGWGIANISLLCQGRDLVLRNVSIPKPVGLSTNKKDVLLSSSLPRFDEGMIWVASRWSYQDKKTRLLRRIGLLHSVNPDTMDTTEVGTIAEEKPIHAGCTTRIVWIDIITCMIVSFILGGWLWIVWAIPSSVVTPSLSVYVLLRTIEYDFGFYVASIGCMVTATFLASKSIVSGIWALYSIVFALVLTEMITDKEVYFMISCFLVVYVGLVLDHPLLQVLGWLGSVVAVFLLLLFALLSANMGVVAVIPICIIISFGMMSVGYTLGKYRTYLMYYSGSLWRDMTRNYDGEQIQRGLMSQP